MDSSKLCDRCRKIDLTPKRFQRYNHNAISLGSLFEWKRDCGFCKCLVTLAGLSLDDLENALKDRAKRRSSEDSESDQSYSLVAFSTESIFEDPGAIELTGNEQPVSFAVIESDLLGSEGDEIFNCVRGRGWLSELPAAKAKNESFTPQELPEKTDVGRVRMWLEHCQTHHKDCRRDAKIPAIKVIDCETRNLVATDSLKIPEAEKRYLTLSYVFGPSQPGDKYVDGRRIINLPPLISDAIELTASARLQVSMDR